MELTQELKAVVGPQPHKPTTWLFVPATRGSTPTLTNISGKGGISTRYNAARFAQKWKASKKNWMSPNISEYTVDPPRVVPLSYITGREKGDEPIDLEFGLFNSYLYENETDRGTNKFGEWRYIYMWSAQFTWSTTLALECQKVKRSATPAGLKDPPKEHLRMKLPR